MTDIPNPTPGSAGSAGNTQGSDEERSKLHSLHTRLVDTLDGYDKVLEKAEPDFVGVAQEFRSLHQGQADRVRAMLIALGEDPSSDGSMFAAVNRAVVAVRSWFDDIDHGIMDAIADGEKRLLDDIKEAIAATASPERRAALEQMHGDTVALLSRHAPDKV